jgi:hypothetical protein
MQTSKVQAEINKYMAILEDKILTVYRSDYELDQQSKELMMNFKRLAAIEFMKIAERS